MVIRKLFFKKNRHFLWLLMSLLTIQILEISSTQANDCKDSFDTGAAVTPRWIKKMLENDRRLPESQRSIQRVIQGEGIEVLSRLPDLLRNHNDIYTLEIPSPDITNQKASGRCWIFAGLNLMRSKLIGDGIVGREFKLSANYLYFFSLLEQSNTYLERVIQGRFQKISKYFLTTRKLTRACFVLLRNRIITSLSR